MRRTLAAVAIIGLTGCGGGTVANAPLGGETLAFAYYQYCVNPIFFKQLQVTVNGVPTVATCGASACHNDATGNGGTFRIIPLEPSFQPNAQPVNLSDPPDVIRQSNMYKNFISAQSKTVIGQSSQSLLLNKPLLSQNVTHGGGLIFSSTQDPNVKVIAYWINHPAPLGQDPEFSTATYATMFTPALDPANPNASACNSN